MDITARQAIRYAAICLLIVVATQVLYIAKDGLGLAITPAVIWSIEAVAFLGITLFALMALAKQEGSSLVWSAIGLGGLFNVIQAGMGLAMFGPLKDAGEALAPAFQSILAGAFFFYFAGKFLFGIAAIALGMRLFASPIIAPKVTGALAMLTGLAAVGLNVAGMSTGMGVVFMAGAAGTAATLFLAIAALMAAPERT